MHKLFKVAETKEEEDNRENKLSVGGYSGHNWENYLGVLPTLWLVGSF